MVLDISLPDASGIDLSRKLKGILPEMVAQYHQVAVAVVLVTDGETRETAWQRYLEDHPECNKECVRIFHFVPT